jgi:predicted transcriptional regulator
MPESTFTFRVDEKLKEQFSQAARRHERAGSQILREFMRKFVGQPEAPAYEEWFAASVREALDDPRPAVPSAAVERHFARRRAVAKRKVAKRAR